MDVFVLRKPLGDRARRAPWSAYIRSAIVAYSVMILFPAGRASAEAARAGVLAKHLGATNVAASASAVLGSSLLGTALITLVGLVGIAARVGTSAKLFWIIAASAVMTTVAGLAFLLGSRSGKVRAFLQKRLRRFRE